MARSFRAGVFSVGAIDWDRRLFDELVALPGGTSYNAYLVKGSEKIALIDTVDPTKRDDLLQNLAEVNPERIDYVISSHAEQDHSGCIPTILRRYPGAKVVCNQICKGLLQDEMEIADDDFILIKDGEELSLGDKTLKFIFTPWVHWPETMCTLLKEERILFTGDFFGSHLATSDLFVREHEDIYECAKRYYSEIMQPFANIIVRNLQKVRAYDIDIIAPTHGPMYADPNKILSWYEGWASPRAHREVVVAFASMHGSTARMVQRLVHRLIEKDIRVQEFNLTHAEIGKVAMAMVDASALVIASPTYLNGLHPVVASSLYAINALHPKTKLVGYLGSGEWGGQVQEDFKRLTSGFKAEQLEPLMIKGAPTEKDFAAIDAYADEIIAKHDSLKDLKEKAEKKSEKEETSKTFIENTTETQHTTANGRTHTEISNAPWHTPAPMTKKAKVSRNNDVTIVLCGGAGQGIQSIQGFLTELLKEEGYYIFSTSELMSRIRGGSNSVSIRVSSEPRDGYMDRVDVFLPLDKAAVNHMEKRVSEDTIIIGDKEVIKTAHNVYDAPFTKLAAQVGQKLYANTIALGVILGVFNADIHHCYHALERKFTRKGEEIVAKNKEAAKLGYDLGKALRNDLDTAIFDIPKHPEAHDMVFVDGAEAIGLGAIAGGCNFIAAYPMSPSTGVLVYLAQHRFEFDIVVEQAEDEIAAINMGIGAWYAGARALANSSGGGFALMCEGVSLAAITETPIVIHIAQRPGPATGLPTRTAQEDLELALYSGHGEFVRAIYAPGTVQQGFYLTQHAFNQADEFQIPVFILSDQYFMDTSHNVNPFDLENVAIKKHIVETGEEYKRYAYTENGISPRGIPGYGTGFVSLDSDEHDESGHITESMDVRNAMMQKRMKRYASVQEAVLEPAWHGDKEKYETLIISWGTTYGSVKEAVELLQKPKTAYVHFAQVYPLPKSLPVWLAHAKRIIVIENNATGQFAKLIRRETGVLAERILKYDGIAFSVEELVEALRDV